MFIIHPFTRCPFVHHEGCAACATAAARRRKEDHEGDRGAACLCTNGGTINTKFFIRAMVCMLLPEVQAHVTRMTVCNMAVGICRHTAGLSP